MTPTGSQKAQSGPGASLRRIAAMVLRYMYLLKSSWARSVGLVYWPTMQIILWGFISQFLAGMSDAGFLAEAAGVLLSAVLLWEIMFHGQLGVSLSFFEEIWSRNLGHIMVSPLRPWEFVTGLFVMSLVRTVIGVGAASILAILFFGINVYGLGLMFVLFFANLMIMGWGIGIAIVGSVLRFGMGMEELAWALVFFLAPLSGIYYPIDILPEWGQWIAALLPSAHVFEGMRAILLEGQIRPDLMLRAVGLNVIYLLGGATIFLLFFLSARRRGTMLHLGE